MELTKEQYETGRNLFRQRYGFAYGHLKTIISIEDFEQQCWEKIIKSKYDSSRGKWTTFCFMIANQRSMYLCSRERVSRGRGYNREIFSLDYGSQELHNATWDDQNMITTLLLVDIMELIHSLPNFKKVIPAREIMEDRIAGYTIEEITERIMEKYNIRVTRQCVDLWSKKITSKLKKYFNK